MQIEDLPFVLSWSAEEAITTRVHERYVGRLLNQLGAALSRIGSVDPQESQRLLKAIQALPDHSLQRLLTAPETSYRLLWPQHHTPESVNGFFARAIQAEVSRTGGAAPLDTDIWTALGDARFDTEGTMFSAPRVPDMMSLDFDSPYALGVETSTPSNATSTRESFTPAERHLVLQRLAHAWSGLGDTNARVQRFVLAFTKVLLLQKKSASAHFSSNSRDERIGRSALRNPHLDRADEVDFADALVHEAIHSLLYMHEHDHRWFHDEALYSPEERVTSPWTGNRLPIRFFCHACFVWYGLLHFWCMALAKGTFRDRSRVKMAIAQAAGGFLGGRIVARLEEWSRDINPLLLETIDRMQAHIAGTFSELADRPG